MNETTTLESLSIEDLLRLEEICDQYEAACRSGSVVPPGAFCNAIDETLRSHVLREITTLHSEWQQNGRLPAEETLPASEQSSLAESHSRTRLATGALVDHFRLIEEVGSGACGTVWKAHDSSLRRTVAIKIPHAEFVQDSARFLREAQVAATLAHEHIVRVYETGKAGDTHYIVSELIEGESLHDRIRRDPLPIDSAVTIMASVTDALAYAHERGVVHRDLKPHNVLLDRSGSPHLSDFGLAKHAERLEATLTRQGELLGTPAYMAPEQARGDSHAADARTDIYALGVMLFQLLTGELPFRGRVDAVIHQVLHTDPPSPRKLLGTVPRDLETICLKCLEKDPARRFTTAEELSDELRRFQRGEPIRSRPVSPIGHLAKAARRHPRVAIMSVALACTLVTIAVGATLAAIGIDQARQREHDLRVAAEESEAQEAEAKREAIAAGQRAEREAEISRQSAAFLQDLFQSADPVSLVLRGGIPAEGTPAIEETLRRASRRITNQFREQPRIKTRLTMLLGNACRGVGLYDEASRLLDDANQLRTEHAALFDAESLEREQGENVYYQALLAHDLGDRPAAETLYQQAMQKLTPSDASSESLVAELAFRWAGLKLADQEHAAAERLFEQALAIHRKTLPDDAPQIVACRFGLEMSRTPVGESPELYKLALELAAEDWAIEIAKSYAEIVRLRSIGELNAAGERYVALIEKLRGELGEKHPIFVLALGDCAGLLWEAGNYRLAYPTILDAIERGRELAPEHPKLRHALLKLAFEALRAGRHEEAEGYYREVADVWATDRFDFEVELGLMWTSFARGIAAERSTDDGNSAASHFATALTHSQRLVDHANGYVAIQTAWVMHGHAHVLEKNGQGDLAQEFVGRSYEIVSRVSDWPPGGVWLGRLSIIASRNDDPELAERFAKAALEANLRRFPEDHPRVADTLYALGKIVSRRGDVEAGETMIGRACRIRIEKLPVDDGRVQAAKDWLAEHGMTDEAS